MIAISIVAYVQGAAWERQRRRWIFLMLGTGLVAIAIDIAVQNTIGASEIVVDATLLLIGTIPFGLAYVILRHRVIDVGFVINRAVVYSAVSIIIVGIIVIVETLMSRFVEQHSRAGSMANRRRGPLFRLLRQRQLLGHSLAEELSHQGTESLIPAPPE